MAGYGLSKTKIISGLQCPKRLYLEIHRPELAEQSDHTEQLFSNGNLVGDIARQTQPKGKLIGHTADLKTALTQTAAALKSAGSVTLFEPAFQHGGALVRADVFSRKGTKHHVVEVKSSTSVKDYHLSDAAIQHWVINGAGYPLDSISIAHIDNTFVYQGGGDYRGLLKQVNVTDDIIEPAEQVPGWITDFQNVLAGRMPKVEVGKQCSDPFDCPFLDYCSKGRPEYPVDLLPRGGKVVAALLADGYRDLLTVPASRLEGVKHKLVWRVTKKGKPEIDPQVRKLVRDYAYPRFYLDFETIQFAVPIWKGTRPYEQLPFQWSCHIEREGGEITHREFIDASGKPPMWAFAESLIKALGSAGPILAYSHFEKTIIKALAVCFPDLDVPLNKLIARIKDLRIVTENSYYHPAMKGSWSLKAVLPTIDSKLKYSGEVQDGGAAQRAYVELTDAATNPERREALTRELLEYCKTDTLAMVRLVRFFAGA